MLARVERLIGWRQIAGPLVRRYIVLFLAVVFVVLLANSLLEIGFFYRDHNSLLIRAQREQAEAAAAKIGQFIREIESQLGWTTQLPWSTGTIDQRRFDASRLLRQVQAITEFTQLDPPARNSCAYRVSPWTWSPAKPTFPRSPSSSTRWPTMSITARSISDANPNPI